MASTGLGRKAANAILCYAKATLGNARKQHDSAGAKAVGHQAILQVALCAHHRILRHPSPQAMTTKPELTTHNGRCIAHSNAQNQRRPGPWNHALNDQGVIASRVVSYGVL